jgi:hypothetical protein
VQSNTNGKWDAPALTLVINVVLLGAAGVYTTTHSVAITMIACLSAVVLATGILALQRPRSSGRSGRRTRRMRRGR